MAVIHGPRWLGATLFVVTSSVGCGSAPGAGQERYIPTTTTARAAVESALQAWQRGEPVGEVKDTQPPIFVADTQRRKGQTLEHYEILGEVPGATQRCYLIKLTFSNPEAEAKVRYAVVGINPLWVFRHEDLEMLLHWDHPMSAAETTSATTSGPPNEKESR